MKPSIYLALGGLALAVQAAGAQNACDDMKSFFAKPPKLGDWAELRMQMKKGKEPIVSRVGFVGKEKRDGRDLYRMQISSTAEGKRYIMQVLTPWDISALDENYESEVVMKMEGQPAMIMPVKGNEAPGLSDLRKECAKIKLVGNETIEVPAGSFETRHYTGPDGDSWMASEVPGWRLVKMVTDDGDTMELTAVGSGAKNEITEKPVDMKAMMRDPEAMQKMMEGKKEDNK